MKGIKLTTKNKKEQTFFLHPRASQNQQKLNNGSYMNTIQTSLASQILLQRFQEKKKWLETIHTKHAYEIVTKFLVMKLSTFFGTPVNISQK